MQVLGLPAADRFPTLMAVSDFDAASLVMATSSGGIKRTPLTAFSKIRGSGLAAIKLHEVGTNAQAFSPGSVGRIVGSLTSCRCVSAHMRKAQSTAAGVSGPAGCTELSWWPCNGRHAAASWTIEQLCWCPYF